MGTVTSLEVHRLRRQDDAHRARHALPRATLYFDLASPYTYLVAERAERLFAGLEWRPARANDLHCEEFSPAGMQVVAKRAALLRLPLVWPDGYPYRVTRAMRVAALAAELGCAPAFALAAGRLAFCGGFDIDDPEILAEAAAAAGIGLSATRRAARDVSRDRVIGEIGDVLVEAGAYRMPVLRIGGTLFCGEERLVEAAAARTAV